MDVADQCTGQRNLCCRAVTHGDAHQSCLDMSLHFQPVWIERSSMLHGLADSVHRRLHRSDARAHPGCMRHQHRVARDQRCLDDAHEQQHQEGQQQGQLDGGLPMFLPWM